MSYYALQPEGPGKPVVLVREHGLPAQSGEGGSGGKVVDGSGEVASASGGVANASEDVSFSIQGLVTALLFIDVLN